MQICCFRMLHLFPLPLPPAFPVFLSEGRPTPLGISPFCFFHFSCFVYFFRIRTLPPSSTRHLVFIFTFSTFQRHAVLTRALMGLPVHAFWQLSLFIFLILAVLHTFTTHSAQFCFRHSTHNISALAASLSLTTLHSYFHHRFTSQLSFLSVSDFLFPLHISER